MLSPGSSSTSRRRTSRNICFNRQQPLGMSSSASSGNFTDMNEFSQLAERLPQPEQALGVYRSPTRQGMPVVLDVGSPLGSSTIAIMRDDDDDTPQILRKNAHNQSKFV